jgi:hypothetical protein
MLQDLEHSNNMLACRTGAHAAVVQRPWLGLLHEDALLLLGEQCADRAFINGCHTVTAG